MYPPGTIIRARSRLWRVDGQEGNVLIATPIDGGTPEQTKFYVPFEHIEPGRLEPPAPDPAGYVQAQFHTKTEVHREDLYPIA